VVVDHLGELGEIKPRGPGEEDQTVTVLRSHFRVTALRGEDGQRLWTWNGKDQGPRTLLLRQVLGRGYCTLARSGGGGQAICLRLGYYQEKGRARHQLLCFNHDGKLLLEKEVLVGADVASQ